MIVFIMMLFIMSGYCLFVVAAMRLHTSIDLSVNFTRLMIVNFD